MITKKELGYVNLYARNTPYPGNDYCEMVLKELEDSFNLYNEEYKNVKYNISFSNNEEIEFEILDKNICHMLGIDFKSIITDYYEEVRKGVLNISVDDRLTSYKLLEAILKNKDNILEHDSKNRNKIINYYKTAVKCAIFNKMANLSNFNYGCINFDKNILNSNYPSFYFAPNSTKLFYTDSDETVSPYFMMGLREDETEKGIHIVETLFIPEHYEYFFNGQEVVLPTQILVDRNDNLDKIVSPSANKIKLLRDYRNIIINNGFSDRINIYNDYLSFLMNEEKKESKILRK